MIGITNPYSFDLQEYLGYNLSKFKGNIRFLEIVINRNGNSNGICPLFFDGAINDMRELPLPNEQEKLNKYYTYLDNLRQAKVFFIHSFNKLFKH